MSQRPLSVSRSVGSREDPSRGFFGRRLASRPFAEVCGEEDEGDGRGESRGEGRKGSEGKAREEKRDRLAGLRAPRVVERRGKEAM
jgi:hypothetical protein